MTPLVTLVGAFFLALVLAAAVFGGPVVVAIPVAFIGIGAIALFTFAKRRKQATMLHQERERARTDKVDFTERDERTLVSE